MATNSKMATEKFVRDMVTEATDAILTGVGKLFEDFRKEMRGGFTSVDKRFDNVDTKFEEIEGELSLIRRELKEKTSRGEFENLEGRVKRVETMRV